MLLVLHLDRRYFMVTWFRLTNASLSEILWDYSILITLNYSERQMMQMTENLDAMPFHALRSSNC
jgi:hypothetical protein